MMLFFIQEVMVYYGIWQKIKLIENFNNQHKPIIFVCQASTTLKNAKNLK